jgi:(p)ppGpp synthase/HD superfamily hydrolase
MSSLVERALVFATRAHESIGQKRKYTGEPYINHPVAVCKILQDHSSWPVSDEMIAASLCHDTVEDTPVTIEQITDELGKDVANLVFWLTNPSRPEDGNRKTRKAIDRAHTAQAPVEAKNIKLADLCHNAHDIVNGNPGFARKWLGEMAQTLEVVGDADPALLKLAHQTLINAQDQLKEMFK